MLISGPLLLLKAKRWLARTSNARAQPAAGLKAGRSPAHPPRPHGRRVGAVAAVGLFSFLIKLIYPFASVAQDTGVREGEMKRRAARPGPTPLKQSAAAGLDRAQRRELSLSYSLRMCV